MCSPLGKIKAMQQEIINKAKKFPLHAPEVVEISQKVDKYVITAMKEINSGKVKI